MRAVESWGNEPAIRRIKCLRCRVTVGRTTLRKRSSTSETGPSLLRACRERRNRPKTVAWGGLEIIFISFSNSALHLHLARPYYDDKTTNSVKHTVLSFIRSAQKSWAISTSNRLFLSEKIVSPYGGPHEQFLYVKIPAEESLNPLDLKWMHKFSMEEVLQ